MEPKQESMPLSELESALLAKFQTQKEIEPKDLTQQELGALGKLGARRLVEKASIPIAEGNPKLRRVWRLIEAKEAILEATM